MAQRTVEMDEHLLLVQAVQNLEHQSAQLQAQALELQHQSALLATKISEHGAADPDADRARRREAIMSMHGIWKNDSTKPRDGAEYQREVHAEWQ